MKGKLLKAVQLPGFGANLGGFVYVLTIETKWLKRVVEVVELVGYHININEYIGKNIHTVSKP